MSLAHRFFALLYVLLILVTAYPAIGCDAIPILVNSTVRAEPAGGLSSRQTFVFEVPATGMVSLYVSTPAEGTSHLLLRDAGPDCPGASPLGDSFVSQDPASWVFAVQEAGTIAFTVASDDHTSALPAFKLRIAFAAESEAPAEVLAPMEDVPDRCGAILGGRGKLPSSQSDHSVFANDVDPWEDDIIIGHRPSGIVASLESSGLPLRVTMWSGSHCTAATQTAAGALAGNGERVAGLLYAGPFEVAIDSWAGSAGANTLAIRSYDLCSEGEIDDHADNPSCATALKPSNPLSGTLTNRFGDDEDFATFVLDRTATMALNLASRGSSALRLLDDHGQLLGEGTPAAASHVTLTRSLAAGRYFAVVTQTEPEEVSYELSLDFLAQ
jgi:hypothetical protein